MAASDVAMTVDWSAETGRLRCRYGIVNGSGRDVVLFDRLFVTAPSGERRIEPDLAWLTVSPEGVLFIDKLVPPIPEDREVEFPLVPYARRIVAGARIGGEAVVPLPLVTQAPYDPPGSGAGAPRAGRAVLRLGYAVIDEDMPAKEISGEEGGILSIRHAWANMRQRVLTSAPVAVDLEVHAPGPTGEQVNKG